VTLLAKHVDKTEGKAQQFEGTCFDIIIKFIKHCFSTKGTLREKVYLRLIKPTTQLYLGNVRLLTRSKLMTSTLIEKGTQWLINSPSLVNLSDVGHFNTPPHVWQIFDETRVQLMGGKSPSSQVTSSDTILKFIGRFHS
jgi:hypothetical protein